MAQGKTAVVVALITAGATIAVALINNDILRFGGGEEEKKTVVCQEIPRIASSQSPSDRKGYLWQPSDHALASDGTLSLKRGKWVRNPSGIKKSYVYAHWDTSSGECKWVAGSFR